MSRYLSLALVVLGSLFGVASGQTKDRDLLDEIRRREKIAAEALEADVKAAYEESDKLRAKDPKRAVLVLKYALAKVEADTALTAKRRRTLKNSISARIDAIQAGEKPEPLPPPPGVEKPDPREPGRDGDLQQQLKQLRILRQLGEYKQAAILADDLARRYKDDAAVAAARRITANDLQLREQAKFLDEKAWKTALALNEVDRAAVPMVGDIEYPKDWAEKSARRLKKYQQGLLNLSKKEEELLKILDSPLSKQMDFKDTPFDTVLDYFATEFKLPMIVDRDALKDLDLSYDKTRVLAKMPKGVSVRTAFRAALADAGLTFIIKNEVIRITTPERAGMELVTRVYPISDLLGTGSPFLLTNPFAQQLQKMEEAARVEKLIEMIKGLVDPGAWQPLGPGTIEYDPLTKSLIIKGTSEVINSLGGGLKK